MRGVRVIGTAVLILGVSAAGFAAHHEDLLAEVTAIGDALAAAMLANDAETMLAMYAEDAISLPNYGPRMQGSEAFRRHHEEMSAAGMKILSFSSDPTEAWAAGDHVIEIGTFEITLEMPGMPNTIEDRGKYMTVYVRNDEGALKIKAETWNTDVNPMMMAGKGHGHEPADDDSEAEKAKSDDDGF
jgi:uncharacterized protein (TIGR02246 family)